MAQKPWQVAIAGVAVQVLAQIAPQLSAGICDASGPVAGLRIQHDVRGFDAGCGQHNHLGINFHFFSGSAVYKRDALRHAVLVNQDASHQRIGQESEVLGGFSFRDGKPRGREKRSNITAAAAVPAVVTGRMIVVVRRELSAAVGQVRDADFFGSLLDDVINTAKGHGRQVLAIGITGPILNRAGHAHVSLGLGKPWRNLRVIYRPVFTHPIQVCGLEIDVAEARRGAPPKIGFPAGCLAPFPVPVRARGV